MWGKLYSGFRRGMPIAAIPVRWFVTVTEWLNGMQIQGGRIERTPNGIIIYPNTDSPATEILGDKELYKVVVVREYTESSGEYTIVAIGSETGSGTLLPTYDWTRAH